MLARVRQTTLQGWTFAVRCEQRVRDVLEDAWHLRHLLRSGGASGIPGAYASQNTHYSVLDAIWRQIDVAPDDVLVDVGCGHGRVLAWLARRYPHNRVIGVEIDGEVASEARQTLARYRNAEVVVGSAAEVLPVDGTLYYLFNPFDGIVTGQFRERLRGVSPARERLRVVYVNPTQLEVFREGEDWTISEQEVVIHGVLRQSWALIKPTPDRGGGVVGSRRGRSQAVEQVSDRGGVLQQPKHAPKSANKAIAK